MKESADEYPNRFDFATAQPRLLEFWEQKGYYHANEKSDKPPFCIVIPPPNVTGALHLGHALNNTLQDVTIRFKRMQGFETLWMPGTDHAGIATQAVVERRLREEEGKTRRDLGREALVARIWKWKDEYEARILGQLKRMGASCDWARTRFTLDERCAKAVRVTFFDLFSKDLIYRGKRLVNWDTFLQTAVSDDEVFQETVKGHFWHINYTVIDPQEGEPAYVTVATTRPETLLGDTAVAVHPQPSAALEKVRAELVERIAKGAEKERAPLQAELEALDARRDAMLASLEQLAAMAQAGRMLKLPLLGRPIPLVADIWAKPELGSGCVKITPAHDPNDYEVGKRCSLPMINILNPEGTLNSQAGPYEGLTIRDARKRVVADLESAGQLALVEDREIELPHSDRSKTPIEPYLADQWFVRMDTLAQMAMDAVTNGEVRIHPARYAKGYLDWLGEKRDWPVSRQLWWGHQIPVWSRTWEMSDEQAALASQASLQSLEGAGQSLELKLEKDTENDRITLHVCIRDEQSAAIEKIEAQGFVRSEDVLDTWFSSALWPHSTLGWPSETDELAKFYPTSTLITSRDIITLWVARMVLMGLNNMGQVPFRDVFIHPKILDGFGETMSKTRGNGIDPLDVIDKFGADALRYGMTFLTTDTQDVRLPVQYECPHCEATIDQTKKNRDLPRVDCPKCGKPFKTQWARTDEDRALARGLVLSERFEVARNFTNKLWNAARFAILNLEGYTPEAVDPETLPLEDRWILSRIATVTRTVTESLDRFEFSEAARTLYEFAWDDFCSFYVEILKDRFADPASRPVAQRVMAHVLDTLLRLLHPIKPFLTEEIWQKLAQWAPARGLTPEQASESVTIASWPKVDEQLIAPEIEAQFARFQTVLGAIREVRSVRNIPPKADLSFVARCDPSTVELLAPMAPYFASMARATSQGWGQDGEIPHPNATAALPGIELYIDLKGFINEAEERARLSKELEKLVGMCKSKEAKLSNESFTSRAPAEVVQREREHLSQMQEQMKTLEEAIAALKP